MSNPAWFEHEVDAWLDAKSQKRDAVLQRVRN
jgi:predicted DNA-binding transcriptional regulator AlpA